LTRLPLALTAFATILLEDRGDADAEFTLGAMHELGNGAPRDRLQAIAWYHKAARQGQTAAQFALGDSYEYGYGVTQDYVTAHMWYSLAASAQGEKFSSISRSASESRDDLAAKMTLAQIAEAQRLAREWQPKDTSDAATRAADLSDQTAPGGTCARV
jgi:TPR repeat protein